MSKKNIPNPLKNFKKSTIIKTIILIILIGGFIALLISCSAKKDTGKFVEENVKKRSIKSYHTYNGTINPVNDVSIFAKRSTKVTDVFFKEGDEVKIGDVIAQLDDSDLRNTIRESEESLSANELSNFYAIRDAKKNYDDLANSIANGTNSSILAAEASLENARIALNDAQDKYTRSVMEYTTGIDANMLSSNQNILSRKIALEQAETHLNDAQAALKYAEDHEDQFPQGTQKYEEAVRDAKKSLESAQLSYDNAVTALMSSNYNTNVTIENNLKKLEQAKDAYARAQASYESTLESVNNSLVANSNAAEKATNTLNNNLALIRLENLYDQLDDYKIISTIDGVITELNAKVGDTLTSAKAGAIITDYSDVLVKIKMSEYDYLGVDIGAPVEIYVSAIKQEFKGTITKISKRATSESGIAYFSAEASFETSDAVRAGLSAEAKVISAEADDVLSVSVDAVKFDENNKPYVYTSIGKNPNKKYIETGISNGMYIEVKSGLKEGEKIYAETKTLSIF